MTMKIVVLTDTYEPQKNGVVVYLRNSLELLAKKNKIVLFAPGTGKNKEYENRGIRTVWLPAMEFPFYKGYLMAKTIYPDLKKMIISQSPDVVHAHAPVLMALQGFIAAKRAGIPTVITYHTHLPEYFPHLLKGMLPDFLSDLSKHPIKYLIKKIYSQADIVTAPTKELVKELTGYGLKNVVYLPNGVNISKFKKRETTLRKKYGIPKKAIVILYAGRISFEKRLEILLEAFKKIEKKDRYLVIAGSGPYLEKYKEIATAFKIKNILFTGLINDKEFREMYSAADIFATPSDTETFGLTIIEAMAAGLPVVAVSKLGPKELVNNGKDGYTVDAGNVNVFSEKLRILVTNDKIRKMMGKHALKQASKFSLEQAVKKTLRIYEMAKIERFKYK
ncbi:MAG: glycosyltransferase [Candidatus Micrarchaeota archaeon]